MPPNIAMLATSAILRGLCQAMSCAGDVKENLAEGDRIPRTKPLQGQNEPSKKRYADKRACTITDK